MKRIIIAFLGIIFFLIIGLPSIIVWGSIAKEQSGIRSLPRNESIKGKDRLIKVKEGNEKKVLELDEYLQGVVAGEMPAGFALEALKAQAIAARTYALKQTDYGKKAISTDFKKAQAWISEDEMKKRWGSDYQVNRDRIRQAVLSTKGEVLFYQGELINAYYHSTCGGRTESSEAAFGKSFPYLSGVACKWDKRSFRYHDEKSFNLSELKSKLQLSEEKIGLKILQRTKSGRIAEIRVGNKSFTGTQLRFLLGLRSTNFKWKLEEDKITFYTTGYGHGVGLCQFGADGLAKDGKDVYIILNHYYPGTKVVKVK